jgi:hypothetical protein
MRVLLVTFLVALIGGCAGSASSSSSRRAQPEDGLATTPLPANRNVVRVDGIDGTVMTGEMLNGSLTVDSGQGPLTLQSGHIYTITIGSDGDRIEADNISVAGKIRETQFNLRTQHGVFQLLKERVRRITFVNNTPDPDDLALRTAPDTSDGRLARPAAAPAPPAATSTSPAPSTRSAPPPTASRYLRRD